jgi:DNA topoisomerase-1
MTIVEKLQNGGLLRIGTPSRGFRYRGPGGRKASATERARIDALRIPPAWKKVAISLSPSAPVQAIGMDAAGRWQYLYHPSQIGRRERSKRRRLIRFIEALPHLREAVRRDLARPGLPREKVLAGILQILGVCFLRPGSKDYADENGSYGVATLKREHVKVQGDRIFFDFPGKSRQRQQRELRDRRLARLVRKLLEHPGEVFKYEAADGTLVDVRRRHINAYIKSVMGESFSAKDFRTWAANLLCAAVLARTPTEASDGSRERKRQVAAAIREVARHLGNTPAVCRASYVFDAVVEGCRARPGKSSPFAQMALSLNRGGRKLGTCERALVRLLRRSPEERAAPRRHRPTLVPRAESAPAGSAR